MATKTKKPTTFSGDKLDRNASLKVAVYTAVQAAFIRAVSEISTNGNKDQYDAGTINNITNFNTNQIMRTDTVHNMRDNLNEEIMRRAHDLAHHTLRGNPCHLAKTQGRDRALTIVALTSMLASLEQAVSEFENTTPLA